jgi:hypothetical protein
MSSPHETDVSFLLGIPRSGTTLLATMLDRHPDIAVPPEPWLMLALDQFGRVPFRHPANANVLAQAIDDLLPAELRIAAAASFARTVYRTIASASGKKHFVDKTPRYHHVLPLLASVCPGSRHIILLRNPLDVAASMRSTWRVDSASLITSEADHPCLFDLVLGPERLLAFAEDHQAQVMVVRYEDLVEDPPTWLAEIVRFLGQSTDPMMLEAMLAFGGAARHAGRMGDQKILATDRPHARSVGAWKAAFTVDELQRIADGLGRDHFEKLGYADAFAALVEFGVEDRGEKAALGLRSRLTSHLSERTCAHGELEAELANLRTNVAQLNTELANVRAEETNVRAVADVLRLDLNAVSAEIDGLYASTSWRLTRPLRRVAAWMRRI